jgi:hypothetical protein
MHSQQKFPLLLLLILPAAAATPVWGQTIAPTTGPSSSGTLTSASVPDFPGIWTHPYFGISPPRSGPGPVDAASRSVVSWRLH